MKLEFCSICHKPAKIFYKDSWNGGFLSLCYYCTKEYFPNKLSNVDVGFVLCNNCNEQFVPACSWMKTCPKCYRMMNPKFKKITRLKQEVLL